MSNTTHKGGEVIRNVVDCKLDNLVIYVERIDISVFELFKNRLERAEEQGKIPPIRFTIGKGYSDYHYRLNVGQGGGAITIGYKHNSARSSETFYTMRVEFNPQKNQRLYEGFWEVFRGTFEVFTKRIKQLDLAFDVPVHNKKIFAFSLTGRQKSYYRDTLYFGSSGNTGRLKIYDKKAELDEKQGVAIVDEHRTRIEYTIKFDEPMTLQLFSKVTQLSINAEYEIVHLDVEKLTGEVKAAVLAIHHDWMKMSEFTRTTKTKIKSAMASMEKFDLDHAYQIAQEKIIKEINSYLTSV